MKAFNPKLVRDKVPQEIFETGRIPVYRVAQDSEVLGLLFLKLLEECEELRTSVFSEDSSVEEEMSDVFEVLSSICSLQNISIFQLFLAFYRKRKIKGSFQGRIILQDIFTQTTFHESKE